MIDVSAFLPDEPEKLSPSFDLTAYAARAVAIDQDDLVGEYTRVSADLAYFGLLTANAEAAHQRASDAVKAVKGQATLAAIAAGHKPQAKVDALVAQMPAVQDAQDTASRLDGERRQLRAIVDAISAKLQALVSLGAHLRREMDSTRYT